MGLLFTPRKVRNIWQERGFKKGVESTQDKAEAEIAYTKAEATDWFTRMKQAEKEGRDFNEPPPFLDDNGDEHRNGN